MTNTFATAIQQSQMTTTTNGMAAHKTTGNAITEFFFKAGAMRGQNIVPLFIAAYVEDKELALRLALYLRDAREGMGERAAFKQILNYLEVNAPQDAERLMMKIHELGRFDDLFAFTGQLKSKAFTLYGDYLRSGNALAAKWAPREKSAKKELAKEFREFFGLTPKNYRKLLSSATKVVETQMCAKDFDSINFSHVPSVAHARYKKAFNRNTTKYAEYVSALTKGDPSVKINASAVFPHVVLQGRIKCPSYGYTSTWDATELAAIEAQWNALPNYVGDAKVLPLVDVSGSMESATAGEKSSVTCLQIAVSLGLYLADKNEGKFKDCFLTFHSNPELLKVQGQINQKIDQMVKSAWGGSTNLEKAFDLVLRTAINGQVPQSEMPEFLVVLSDMQFNSTYGGINETAFKMAAHKYATAGYQLPKLIWWNLSAHDSSPVKFDQNNSALVSGFSPAIMKSVLSANFENFTPMAIVLEAIMQDRYTV